VMNSILKTRRELSAGIEPDMLPEISPQSRPVSGAVTGLTLLLDFPDSPGTIPRSEVENCLNLHGYANFGCNGSVRDYFSDVSGGLLDYTNHITEYYTAIHNKSYYTDPSIRYGVRARELIREALAYLDEAVDFDFSALTTDADGNILAINALYAGEVDNSWSEGLWPHKWILFPVFRTDGVRSRSYQITAIRNDLSLRVFCHENGHMLLGWPDLYDYGDESRGIGDYGLMGYGGHNDNPVPPCAHLRIMAGWDTVIDITDASPGETFTHTQGSQTTFLYTHPANPFEYYLFESRIKTGRNASIMEEKVTCSAMVILICSTRIHSRIQTGGAVGNRVWLFGTSRSLAAAIPLLSGNQ
jgi:M6 family metalloprotease-like protein